MITLLRLKAAHFYNIICWFSKHIFANLRSLYAGLHVYRKISFTLYMLNNILVTTIVWSSKMYGLLPKLHTASEFKLCFGGQQEVRFSSDSIVTCSQLLQES